MKRVGNRLEGWAIKYNKPSNPLAIKDGRKVYEAFAPGAFRQSIVEIQAGRATFDINIGHESYMRIDPKSFTIEDKPEGVWVEIDLGDDDISRTVWEAIDGGDVGGMSIEGRKTPGHEPRYRRLASGDWLRTFERAELTGVAITERPAYSSATVFARTDTDAKAETDTIEAEVEQQETIETKLDDIKEKE